MVSQQESRLTVKQIKINLVKSENINLIGYTSINRIFK